MCVCASLCALNLCDLCMCLCRYVKLWVCVYVIVCVCMCMRAGFRACTYCMYPLAILERIFSRGLGTKSVRMLACMHVNVCNFAYAHRRAHRHKHNSLM